MTVIIILAIILSLILLFLFSPVVAYVGYENDFSLNITFFGLKIFDTEKPKKEEKPTEYQKNKKNKKSNEKFNAKTTFANLKKIYGFTGAISKIMAFVLKVLSHIKGILRHVNIYKVKLDIVVASEDAAKTAILTGVVSQSVAYLCAILDNHTNVGRTYRAEIAVLPNFLEERSRVEGKFIFSLRTVRILEIGLRLSYLFLKNKFTQKTVSTNTEGE